MTTFEFGAPFVRTAVALSGEVPYVQPDTRPRMFSALAEGCYCRHDGPRTASLTQRRGGAWLQCDACGSAVGTAMRRAAHQKFDSYPVWRQNLADDYALAEEAYRQTIPTFEDKQIAREQEYVRRSIEYEAWCRTSPEWSDLKKKILWRSRGHCEACLSAPAEVVHHLTYEAGKLPPAWHLKAVCIECHGRLHWRKDDWCAYGMARGQE